MFVPYGQQVNEAAACRWWTHCLNRRYEFVALLREWSMVDRMLGAGRANIVIMPSADSAAIDDDGDTVRLWPAAAPPLREAAPDLGAPRRRVAAANGRFVSGRLPRERVRELLDEPGDVTAPVGVDPESIAALRRIARRLRGPSNESPSR